MPVAMKFLTAAGVLCNLAGLANFSVDTLGGASALVSLMYTACGELLWRTSTGSRTAQENHTTDRNTMTLCVSTIFSMLTVANLSLWLQSAKATSFVGTLLCFPSDRTVVASLRYLGFVGMGLAMLIRRSAMLTLGDRFTSKLTVLRGTTSSSVECHKICDTGLYRFVRHPGYTANLLFYASYALACTGNPWISLINVAQFAFSWTLRARAEEAMLLQDPTTKDAYATYLSSVPCRFVPLLW